MTIFIYHISLCIGVVFNSITRNILLYTLESLESRDSTYAMNGRCVEV